MYPVQSNLEVLLLRNQRVNNFRGPHEREALGMSISLHVGSSGQPGVGSSTRDFERWLKVALEVGHFSLWELCEGNLEGGFPCWGPWRIGRKGSGDGHLFP